MDDTYLEKRTKEIYAKEENFYEQIRFEKEVLLRQVTKEIVETLKQVYDVEDVNCVYENVRACRGFSKLYMKTNGQVLVEEDQGGFVFHSIPDSKNKRTSNFESSYEYCKSRSGGNSTLKSGRKDPLKFSLRFWYQSCSYPTTCDTQWQGWLQFLRSMKKDKMERNRESQWFNTLSRILWSTKKVTGDTEVELYYPFISPTKVSCDLPTGAVDELYYVAYFTNGKTVIREQHLHLYPYKASKSVRGK